MSYQPVEGDEVEDGPEAVSSIPEPNPAAYVRMLISGDGPVAHSDLALSPFPLRTKQSGRYPWKIRQLVTN